MEAVKEFTMIKDETMEVDKKVVEVEGKDVVVQGEAARCM